MTTRSDGGTATDPTGRRAAFLAMHRPGEPFLLPNAWDVASARALAGLGFAAVGTTSLGVAAVAGLPDGESATRAETVALARSLADLPALVTVDVEGGFSDDPDDVADLAATLAGTGAVGLNLEDGRADGTLAPVELHAAKVAAVKERVPDLVVNARTDVWWLDVPSTDPLGDALHRAGAYRDAGADVFFAPLAPDDVVATVAAEGGLPLNVLHRPGGPGLRELGDLGVARVSTGSGLYRTALRAALAAAVHAAGPATPSSAPAVLTYADVQALLR